MENLTIFDLNSRFTVYSLKRLQTFLLLMALFKHCNALTCTSSVSNSNAIITQIDSFSVSSVTKIFGIKEGPVSRSIYYMYGLTQPDYTVLRKINSDNSLNWMISISFYPIVKGLSVDSNEQYLYFGGFLPYVNVLQLQASTGTIITIKRFSFLNGHSHDILIHLLSDNSGYYITGADSSGIANICKYIFSILSTCQCQQINSFNNYAFGQLKISDTQFFFLSDDPSTHSLHFYKFTFSSTSPDWADKLVCSSGACTSSTSESLLSSDKSKIYSFFIYGSTKYLYFTTISVSDGSIVSSRYKSSSSISALYNSALNNNFIVATMYSISSSILILDLTSSTFTFKLLANEYLLGCAFELSSGRFILGGK